jgi:predicted CopG family antitoxin
MSELAKQIKIRDETYDELVALSTNKNDTFDSIIKKCIESYKKAQRREKPLTVDRIVRS